MPTPDIIAVSAGLVFRAGKLLITQRLAKDHLGGLWEFPGGKLEPGETYEISLVRELREELGIEVAVGELVETIEHDYPGKSVRLKFFRCRLLENEPQPLGCAAVAWITRDQLSQYEFPPADERLLEQIRRREELWRDTA
jgi:mutator protein MutT